MRERRKSGIGFFLSPLRSNCGQQTGKRGDAWNFPVSEKNPIISDKRIKNIIFAGFLSPFFRQNKKYAIFELAFQFYNCTKVCALLISSRATQPNPSSAPKNWVGRRSPFRSEGGELLPRFLLGSCEGEKRADRPNYNCPPSAFHFFLGFFLS